jgi:hypothetical protein
VKAPVVYDAQHKRQGIQYSGAQAAEVTQMIREVLVGSVIDGVGVDGVYPFVTFRSDAIDWCVRLVIQEDDRNWGVRQSAQLPGGLDAHQRQLLYLGGLHWKSVQGIECSPTAGLKVFCSDDTVLALDGVASPEPWLLSEEGREVLDGGLFIAAVAGVGFDVWPHVPL